MDSILARLDDRLRKFSGTEGPGKDEDGESMPWYRAHSRIVLTGKVHTEQALVHYGAGQRRFAFPYFCKSPVTNDQSDVAMKMGGK